MSAAGESVVSVRGLTRRYSRVTALDDVNLELAADTIHGLLGRNGAGKTTLLQILVAQRFASGGHVRLFGSDPYENDAVLQRVCMIRESQTFPDSFRVKHVVKAAAMLYPRWDGDFAEELLRDFDLPSDRSMKKLSRGMLSAVGVVVGLASRAELTLFDEPYLGLDAVARQLFYDRLLADYAEHPRTVVLSTHLIDEVSGLIEHVVLLDHGRVVLDADNEALRDDAALVTGPTALVDRFGTDRRVLHQESLGGVSRATVTGRMGSAGRAEAVALGLEVEPVTLQQLVVRTTSGTRSTGPSEAANDLEHPDNGRDDGRDANTALSTAAKDQS